MKSKFELLDILYTIPSSFISKTNLEFHLYLAKIIVYFRQPKNGMAEPHLEIYKTLMQLKKDLTMDKKSITIEVLNKIIDRCTIL